VAETLESLLVDVSNAIDSDRLREIRELLDQLLGSIGRVIGLPGVVVVAKRVQVSGAIATPFWTYTRYPPGYS
jgi:hypothetical protein